MKHTFKQLDHSSSLELYAEEKFGHIEKYLLKKSSWHAFYSKGSHCFEVEVIVHNAEACFKAHAEGETLYKAIDQVVDKLATQFLKRKDRAQHHKNHDKSKGARLDRLNDQLEYDSNPYFYKKSA